jgi:hypothetical protein
LPFSFSRSALGPGVALFLEWFELFTAFFFLFTSLNILSLRNWVFVHQPFSLGCFHGKNGAFAVIQLPIVPEKIELPKIAMQVFAADVVIDTDETATNERMAAFRSVDVNVAPRIFKRPMTDCFVVGELHDLTRNCCPNQSAWLRNKAQQWGPVPARYKLCLSIEWWIFWAEELTLSEASGSVTDFISRWEASGAAERANYQLFLTELCDFLGVPRPNPTVPDDGLLCS